MILGTIRLFDYRCFYRESPGVLIIGTGITSIIGPNNSGKSSIIKSIYEIRSILKVIADKKYQGALPARAQWELPPQISETDDIISDRENPACVFEIEQNSSKDDDHIKKVRIEIYSQRKTVYLKYFSCAGHQIKEEQVIINSFVEQAVRSTGLNNKNILEFIHILLNCQYFGAFRNIINEGAGEHFDCQIGTGFVTQWNEWKAGPKKSHNRAIGRVTEDIRRLIGANRLEINAATGFKTLQVTVDNRPHKLQDLGAGFSQLVSTLGSALIRQPSFILIDEPELHLHPSLQAEFTNALASHAKQGLIFTTHSIGLARLADRCFTVQRNGDRSIIRPYDRTPNLTEFLGSLGIAGLLELGWSRILLVEGPKDVRTAQQILKLYGKDRQTIVLPLGGDGMANGNVDHELLEVRRLCSSEILSIAALVDSERDSESGSANKARQGFAKICEGLGIRCCVTRKRAIENYIPQKAISSTWPDHNYRELSPYETAQKDGSFWGKSETWRAVLSMTREDFDNTDLGPFFASL